MLLLCKPPCSYAGEYRSSGVGDTGLHLGNSASHSIGQYTSEEAALLRRFRSLLCDVESLRNELAELEPELQRKNNPLVLNGPQVELQQLFGLALRNNPKLKPMRSELAALAARTRLAGAPEDPMAMLEFMDWPATPPLLFNGLQEAGVSIGLSQEFASHGKRGLRKQIASYDERIAQHKLAAMELELCWEIVQIYYDIAGSEAALRSMDRQIELMGILAELGAKRYALGLTPQAELLDVQLRLGLMEKQRVEMRTMLLQQQQELARLLGHPAGFDPLSYRYLVRCPQPQPPQLDREDLLARTLNVHPQYQQLKLEIEQQRWGTELALREYYPDYKLGLRYSVGRMMQDSISASIEVPLLTNKEERQDAMLQEAHAMQLSSEDRLAELPNELRQQLAMLESELAMHGDLVQRYSAALVPQARLAVESMLAGYATGMMELDEVFMALDRALQVENELEQQRIHYVHVLADLQVATAGVFDPGPMLAAAEVAPAGGPSIGESLGAVAVVTPVEPGLDLPQLPTETSEAAPDVADGEFVKQLQLPESDTAVITVVEDTSDSFYQPYIPRGRTD